MSTEHPLPQIVGVDTAAVSAICMSREDASNACVPDSTNLVPEEAPATQPIVCYMYALASCASLNSINYGFDCGVNSGVALYVREEFKLSDAQVGLYFSADAFTAAVGALMSHTISDRCGRLANFIAAQGMALTGIAVCVLSQSFPMLMAGRIFVGLSVGLGMSIDPVYIAETAPAPHRGKLTSWAEIATNVGITLGFFVNWLLQDLPRGVSWRAMLLVGAILPLVLITLALTFMPESPRWLLMKGRVAEAMAILRRSHGETYDVGAVVGGIEEEMYNAKGSNDLGWRPLLCPELRYRRGVALAIFVAISQQLIGLEAVLLRAPRIFEDSGVAEGPKSEFLLTMVMGAVKVIFIVVSACFVDSMGRKPLLLIGIASIIVSLLLIAVGQLPSTPGSLAVVGVMVYVASFSLGLGPVTWLYASELFPSKIRGKGMSLAVFMNRITAATISFTFLPLVDLLGGQAGYFFLLAVITSTIFGVTWVMAYETRGMTLEQSAES